MNLFSVSVPRIVVLIALTATTPRLAEQVAILNPPQTLAAGQKLDLKVRYQADDGSKARQLIVIFQQPKHGVKQTAYREVRRGAEARDVGVELTIPRTARDGEGELFAILSGPGWSPVKQATAKVRVERGADAIDPDTLSIMRLPDGVLEPGQTYPIEVRYHVQPKSSATHLLLVFEQGRHKVKKTIYGKIKKGSEETHRFEMPTPAHAQEGKASIYVALNGKGWNPTAEARSSVDIAAPKPVIDRYGQYVGSDWPGKVKTDQNLVEAWETERRKLATWGRPEAFDRFGGWKQAGWRETATGFYRVVKRDGYWWLISPEGNPCFYTGVCAAPGLNWPKTPVTGREWLFEELPPREGTYGAAWGWDVWGAGDKAHYVSFHTANMIRKFGENNWRREATALTEKRLRTWGFSGIGKWGGLFGDGARLAQVEGLGCFGYAHTHGKDVPKIAGKPDIFNPEVVDAIRKTLARQVAHHRDNPYIVGWGVNNETDWVKKNVVPTFLKQDADIPGKRALVDHALTHYDHDPARLAEAWGVKAASVDELYAMELKAPAKDAEMLRQYFSHEYYRTIYQIMKELAPNHLYFGYWIVPWWWEGPVDWELLAPYVDVIGYDHYNHRHDGGIRKLIDKFDKPVVLGEFSFSPTYSGERGYTEYKKVGAADDAEAGRMYTELIEHAAKDPKCVGALWFLYRDQPVTGRGPGSGNRLRYGEHHAMGLVDMTDTPKWDLVEQVRDANLNASRWRLDAAHRSEPRPSGSSN